MLSSWSPNNPSFGFPKVPSITTKTEERIWQISARVWEAYLIHLKDTIAEKIIAWRVYAKRTHPSQ